MAASRDEIKTTRLCENNDVKNPHRKKALKANFLFHKEKIRAAISHKK